MKVEEYIQKKQEASKSKSLSYPLVERNIDDKSIQYLNFTYKEKGRSGGGGKIKIVVPQIGLTNTRSFDYTPEGESVFKSLGNLGLNVASGQTSLENALDQGLRVAGSDFLARNLTKTISGLPGANQIAASQGYAFNPNMEIYFENQQFRTFSFSFPFLPKNPEESGTIKKICQTFEKYSLPEIESKYRFKYPYTWSISADGPVGFSTKECVITEVVIRYGSDKQVYTTFSDGSPTATTLALTFTEIEQWSRDEIEIG